MTALSPYQDRGNRLLKEALLIAEEYISKGGHAIVQALDTISLEYGDGKSIAGRLIFYFQDDKVFYSSIRF